MAKKDSNAELQEAILVLESKQKEELKRLKKEISDVTERLKPKNLLLAGVNKIRHSSALKATLIVAGVGLVSSIVYKKVAASRRRKHHDMKMNYMRQSQANSQARSISGSLIKYIITAIISQNSSRIKEVVVGLLNKLKTSPDPDTNSQVSDMPSEKRSTKSTI